MNPQTAGKRDISHQRPSFPALAVAVALLLLYGGCLSAVVKPPPERGKVIASGGKQTPLLAITYTVGRLVVVGTLRNEYVSELENLTLSLTITDSRGRHLAANKAGPFDLIANGHQVFSFRLPELHGSLLFNFRYDYHYNDYGMSTFHPDGPLDSDWGCFTDHLVLPQVPGKTSGGLQTPARGLD